jgi:putative transposase
MTAENRKKRLRRLSESYTRSPVYFVTACTRHRTKILANETVHESFVEFAQAGPSHGAWIGDYVLMPDHVHAFVTLDEQKIELGSWGKS